MQERRRFVGDLQLRLQFLASAIERLDLGFAFVYSDLVVEQQVQQLLDAPADPLNLALCRRDAGALLHPKPVHLPGELAAELLEEILPHQFLMERAQHPSLHFLTRDRQRVGARAAVASTEASEVIARVDDEAGTTFAAPGQPREQVLRPAELMQPTPFGSLGPLVLNRRVSSLHSIPQFIVDDAKVRHVADDPFRFRIQPRDALAGIGILEEPLAVPYHSPDVQLVVENADAALRVAVDGARTPE